jgi:hypothetical protein
MPVMPVWRKLMFNKGLMTKAKKKSRKGGSQEFNREASNRAAENRKV